MTTGKRKSKEAFTILSDLLILNSLRAGSEDALRKVILNYSTYIRAVIRNTAGGNLTSEDVEEDASDTFFALWQNPERPTALKLKSYLAATAKHKAISKLRENKGETVPIDDEMQIDSSYSLEDTLIAEVSKRNVREAILAMDSPDKEIFLRHYYKSQTTPVIAEEVGLSKSAVEKRLIRGRKKLKRILAEEEFAQ
jgi:RNA polymerase sigma-70 factor (ECF subfamily)